MSGVAQLRKVSGQSLQSHAVDELGGRIARGAVPVGAVLNPEDLAREFGVSRTIIREAFRTLEALGMIDARPRVGTVIRPASSWDLLDHRVIHWRNDGPQASEQLRELMVLREAIEPTGAGLAAVRATDDELESLDGLFAEMSQAMAANDVAAFARSDAAFHALIVHTSRNAVLQQLLTTLEATLHSRYSNRLPTFSDVSAVALARHGELVAALRARESDAAAEVMRTLIRESQEELFRIEGRP